MAAAEQRRLLEVRDCGRLGGIGTDNCAATHGIRHNATGWKEKGWISRAVAV